MTADFSAAEQGHMRRALQLARRGQGRVEPNPMVGCVLVRRGHIVGEGRHRRYGGAHAEVEALQRAGAAARGATAYVTLEPCCHHGKTPPCTDALVAAGVRRVVVSVLDPFATVNGRGIERLRQAGIDAAIGLREAEARELNAPFLTLVTHQRPYTILKWAQSLDGKIATRTGASRWISSSASRRHAHRLRARVDAIVVGVGTVLADNPLLTARGVPLRRTAARIVLDSRLRVPLGAALLATAQDVPTLVVTTKEGLTRRATKAKRLRRMGAEVVACKVRAGRVDLRAALRLLGERRYTNILVEGGGKVLGALLDLKLADEAVVYVSPRLIGGDAAVGPYRGDGVARVEGASVHPGARITRIGGDIVYRIRFPGAVGATGAGGRDEQRGT